MIALLLTGMAAVLMPFFGRLLWEEFVAWHPVWCATLIRMALRIAPENLRERLAEEWQSYLAETPGYVRKLWNAIGFVFAAHNLPARNDTAAAKNLNTGHGRLIRSIDFAIALSMVIFLAPCFVLLSAMVALTSRGPIVFKYPCIGKDSTIFYAFRFRTIQIAREGELAGFTKVGRLMRATSLDQFPTLFNVLKGDMSFVGPRPMSLRQVANYAHVSSDYQGQAPGVLAMTIGKTFGSKRARRLNAMYRLYRRRKTLGLYLRILTLEAIMNARYAIF